MNKKSLNINDAIEVDLYVDNSSVYAWLTREDARHWRQIKGKYAPTTEAILQAINENCQAAKIKLIPHLIPTDKNIADELSRVPEYIRDVENKASICPSNWISYWPLSRQRLSEGTKEGK